MATFELQVQGLTTMVLSSSTTPTQNELTQFLIDGVLDVTGKWISVSSGDKEFFQRESATIDSNSGLDVGGADIISVIRKYKLYLISFKQ